MHSTGPGVLFAIEGIDGAGKTTHARLLQEDLSRFGCGAVVFKEPGNTKYGRRIRELSLNGRNASPEEEMRLFLEDRKIDVRENIQPALERGHIVIMDRYYFSSMAYQGALGLDPEQIRQLNEAFAPRPALTLILDIDPRTALDRIHARRDVPNFFEREDYLADVRRIFRTFCNGDIACLDSDRPVEEVHNDLLQRMRTVLSTFDQVDVGERRAAQ